MKNPDPKRNNEFLIIKSYIYTYYLNVTTRCATSDALLKYNKTPFWEKSSGTVSFLSCRNWQMFNYSNSLNIEKFSKR